jgi:DNA (cytosine-5)-methyltransferase 1
MTAYYNEYDPFAADWLRNLITADLIAPGEVDERSIVDVQPDDVRGFTQAHFFSGIGIWSHALRLAGWPDDRAIWTGSCPCQGFSVAGAGKSFDDERHLWPEFFRLIRECRPSVVAGEQVASPLALAWLDLVSTDLESAGYAVGAADLCAASVGAPHIRQRLYWMGLAHEERRGQGRGSDGVASVGDRSELGGSSVALGLANTPPGGLGIDGSAPRDAGHTPQCEPACRMADTDGTGLKRPGQAQPARRERDTGAVGASANSRMANSNGGQPSDRDVQRGRRLVQLEQDPLAGFWRGADWIACTDGKARPVSPGTFPLAHGCTGRVGKLRAAGNSLCAQVAQTFIEAVMECIP